MGRTCWGTHNMSDLRVEKSADHFFPAQIWAVTMYTIWYRLLDVWALNRARLRAIRGRLHIDQRDK